MLTSLIGTVEIAIFLLAAFLHLRSKQFSMSSAAALSLILTPALLSFVMQASFLLAVPALSVVVEAAIFVVSCYLILSRRDVLVETLEKFVHFWRSEKVVCTLLLLVNGYLFAAAFLIPPVEDDSLRYHLARVFLWQQENGLILETTTIFQAHRSVFPVGSDILAHLFLRFNSDFGVGVFSLLAFNCILFGSYAVARQFADRKLAFTIAFLIGSMPPFVQHASLTKNDIWLGAVAIVVCLLGLMIRKKPDTRLLLLLIVVVAFGLSVKTTFIAFVVPFFAFVGLPITRKHSFGKLFGLLISRPMALLSVMIISLVHSQIWLYLANHRMTGGWTGPVEFTAAHQNQSGAAGTMANLIRYYFQSLDMLALPHAIFKQVTGINIGEQLTTAYTLLFDERWGFAGTTSYVPVQLKVIQSINPISTWYGPFMLLLVVVAICGGLFGKSHFLRGLALTMVAFVGLIAWQVAWMPWNARFFMPLVVGAAAGGAAFLQSLPTRGKSTIQRGLIVFALLQMLHAVAFNTRHPLLSPDQPLAIHLALTDSVWAVTDWGSNRFFSLGGELAFREFLETVPEHARLAILPEDTIDFYHVLLARPDLTFEMIASGSEVGQSIDYIVCRRHDRCEGQLDPIVFRRQCYEVGRTPYHCLFVRQE